MRFSILSLVALLNAFTVLSLIIPRDVTSLSILDNPRLNELFKRKGGGGGGRSGGSSSSSSSSSSGSSSGSRSSGGSTTGGSASTSNAGGTSVGGSGATRSFGGGRYYGGGAAVPYTAGGQSQRGLRPTTLLPIAGLGFFGGAWLYGAYLYSYPRPYAFYNSSAAQNQTKPVQCLCQEYNPCGCDDSDDNTFLQSVVGDGSYRSLNSSVVRVADINGTSTIILNGTLENGTTAPGVSGAMASARPANVGWMALASVVSVAVWML